MDTNHSKKKYYTFIIPLLIAFSVIFTLFSFAAPYLFTNTTDNPRMDFTQTGAIGDTIGGIMTPFIALAGVFAAFLAFYMQYEANKAQAKLNEENTFFRLLDNLTQKITNYSYSEKAADDVVNFASYKALDNLTILLAKSMNEGCVSLGRTILATMPEKVDDTHYDKILRSSSFIAHSLKNIFDEEKAKTLKQDIIDIVTEHERRDFIKIHVGGLDDMTKEQSNVLETIGHLHFYENELNGRRVGLYNYAYEDLYAKHAAFLDSYTKNITYLLDFIGNSGAPSYFANYLKGNISVPELYLLFYYCASRASVTFRRQIKNYNLLDGLLSEPVNKFVDIPSAKTLKKEFDMILNDYPQSYPFSA